MVTPKNAESVRAATGPTERNGLNPARLRILSMAEPGAYGSQEDLFKTAHKSRAAMIIELTNLADDRRLTATQAAAEIDALVSLGYLKALGGMGLGTVYRTTPEGFRAELRDFGHDEQEIEKRVAKEYPELQAERK